MLTKENSSGFIWQDYPTWEYISRSGKGMTAHSDGSRMTPCPKGYREVVRYANADEAFAAYEKGLIEEHKELPDSKFIEHPHGIFIGHWRDARWYDAANRRGLAKGKSE